MLSKRVKDTMAPTDSNVEANITESVPTGTTSEECTTQSKRKLSKDDKSLAEACSTTNTVTKKSKVESTEKKLPRADDYDIVLLDIEGTTTKISFVHDVLFPYVKEHCEDYLRTHWGSEELLEDVNLLREQSLKDVSCGMEGVVGIPELYEEDGCDNKEEVIQKTKGNILWQMSFDRKIKPLKQFQGHVWRVAYENGEVKSHVYGDVVPGIDSWRGGGKKIYIYSSGSVEAQRLLFGYTEEGDLLGKLDGYFDTSVGLKIESGSYERICDEIGVKAERVLFLTDNVKEVEAAVLCGVKAVVCCREENAPLSDDDLAKYMRIEKFTELFD